MIPAEGPRVKVTSVRDSEVVEQVVELKAMLLK